jgi:hypothetical protein
MAHILSLSHPFFPLRFGNKVINLHNFAVAEPGRVCVGESPCRGITLLHRNNSNSAS